jgi:uncharacterized protein YndB with AHSA1/START domain
MEMTDLTLTVERTIKAAQAEVFNAWLNPDMLRKFMLPGPDMFVPKASSDPKPGGRFEIIMQGQSDPLPHSGTYKEISPYDRIVFSWESPFSTDDSLVTLTFKALPNGTHLTLTHVRFLDAEARDNHQGGWTNILETLEAVLA